MTLAVSILPHVKSEPSWRGQQDALVQRVTEEEFVGSPELALFSRALGDYRRPAP
jgi:hypothetical protein